MDPKKSSASVTHNRRLSTAFKRLQLEYKRCSLANNVKQSKEYRKKREKNNEAVKRSRMKSKAAFEAMTNRVQELHKESEWYSQCEMQLESELRRLKHLLSLKANKANGNNSQSVIVDLTFLQDFSKMECHLEAYEENN